MPPKKPEAKTDAYVQELLKPKYVTAFSKTCEGLKDYGKKFMKKV